MVIYEERKPVVKCPRCGTVFGYTGGDCRYAHGGRSSRMYLYCPSCGMMIFPSLMDCGLPVKKPGLIERFFGRKMNRTVVVKANVSGRDVSVRIPGKVWNSIGSGSAEWNEICVSADDSPDCRFLMLRSAADYGNVVVDIRETVRSVHGWVDDMKFSDDNPVKELTSAVAGRYDGRCFAVRESGDMMEVFGFTRTQDGLAIRTACAGAGIHYDETHTEKIGCVYINGDDGWCLPAINMVERGDSCVSEISGEEFESMLADIESLSKDIDGMLRGIRETMGKHDVYS